MARGRRRAAAAGPVEGGVRCVFGMCGVAPEFTRDDLVRAFDPCVISIDVF